MIKAILTDIEGTTTSIRFVTDILFPFSRTALPTFIHQNINDPFLAIILDEVRTAENNPNLSIQEITPLLLSWIDQDKKITPLNTLQGKIWQTGYESHAIKGHLYQDAYQHLTKWHQNKIPLYVYSSGSVDAQKLLFKYSEYGDLTPLFSGFFDTKIGHKREALSYQAISEHLHIAPHSMLFLSDIVEELDAAKAAGFLTYLVQRTEEAQKKTPCLNHPIAAHFGEIQLN